MVDLDQGFEEVSVEGEGVVVGCLPGSEGLGERSWEFDSVPLIEGTTKGISYGPGVRDEVGRNGCEGNIATAQTSL